MGRGKREATIWAITVGGGMRAVEKGKEFLNHNRPCRRGKQSEIYAGQFYPAFEVKGPKA